MPGMVVEGAEVRGDCTESTPPTVKDNGSATKPAVTTTLGSLSQPGEALEVKRCVDTSIERLYDNVCEMQSSGEGSPSRRSFGSDGDESRIDSELRHLVGVQVEEEAGVEQGGVHDAAGGQENGSAENDTNVAGKAPQPAGKPSSGSSNKQNKAGNAQVGSDGSNKSKQRKISPEKSDRSAGKTNGGSVVSSKKANNSVSKDGKVQNGGADDPPEASLDNPNLGPYLLKHARDLVSADNHRRALDYAVRAAKSFERCANGKPSLDLVMSLHVLAAIHCSIGQHDQALPILHHALEIPVIEEGQEHALAKFAGHMQLGDTYVMVGQLENAITSYSMGLEIQRQALGETDPRVGETCRYLAEVHMQALQFNEAERLCKMALDIHKESGEVASSEETADRRLMGLICETKEEHESALEHLVLASMAMVANGQETEVASVDCSIGDTYLSMARYDEAVFAYQKALTTYKAARGDNHPSVASVFVRLADLYNKIGKIRESKSYCENALRIYGKPPPGTPLEDIASGYTEVSAVYESMDEHDQALKLLKKALRVYDDAPGHHISIAGIEAQIGVIYYVVGNYSESYNSLRSAIAKLRASGEKRSAFFGIVLNQMGLACVQCYAISEAVDLFEEAKGILEQEYGPYHPHTLGVYGNLAGTYDAVGRLDDAIEILECIVSIREEKLGTANPDVDEEKRRLAELLKEAGRVRSRKALSLENLLDTNPRIGKKGAIAAA